VAFVFTKIKSFYFNFGPTKIGMEDSTSKEKVLKRIRKALLNKSTEAIANVVFGS